MNEKYVVIKLPGWMVELVQKVSEERGLTIAEAAKQLLEESLEVSEQIDKATP